MTKPTTRDDDSQPELIAVPIPPLATILSQLERTKGAPLTETEVVDASAKVICLMMSVERAKAMSQARGYDDIDPHNAWADWQRFRDHST